MGNHNDGTVFCQCGKGFLDQYFIFRIGKSSSFIQHRNRSILQNRSGQCDALLFAAGKIGSFGTNLCIKTIRQFIKNIFSIRLSSRMTGFCK